MGLPRCLLYLFGLCHPLRSRAIDLHGRPHSEWWAGCTWQRQGAGHAPSSTAARCSPYRQRFSSTRLLSCFLAVGGTPCTFCARDAPQLNTLAHGARRLCPLLGRVPPALVIPLLCARPVRASTSLPYLRCPRPRATGGPWRRPARENKHCLRCAWGGSTHQPTHLHRGTHRAPLLPTQPGRSDGNYH